MKRLNQERQQELSPLRMQIACTVLTKMGFEVEQDESKLWFTHKDEKVIFFPYTGWATGKSIKDGRGLENLVKQLK